MFLVWWSGAISNKEIWIPKDKKWTKNYIEGLLEHEIGVHINRSENGNKSKLQLLGLGLAGYLKGEEGLAMYMELKKYKNKLPGIGNLLAISLCCGINGESPKTFREVYEIMCEYQLFLNNITNPDNYKKNKYEFNDRAWELTWRAFRGTTGNQTTGECFTRDSIYFNGFNSIKDLFDINDKELSRLFIGKYDPVNVDHVKILDDLENQLI